MKFTNNTPMLDLLFNMVLLFYVTTVLMATQAKIESNKKKEAKVYAEFLITVEWDADRKEDIDTYLEDPLGNLLFYADRSVGLMHLDRDDRGVMTDTIAMADGTQIEVKENREITTIRGIVPGEYCLNLHYWGFGSFTPEPVGPKVKVKIEKINPSLKVVFMKEVLLENHGDEITVCRFTLDKDGNITEINNLEKYFIQSTRG